MSKYKTVVIDPPWKLDLPKKLLPHKSGYTEKIAYKMMTDKEILDFPIDDFAEENSLLFMWTVYSKMRFAFDILEKWGFTFKIVINWNKIHGVTHNGLFRQIEPCLMSCRGSMKNLLNYKRGMPIYVEQKRGRHSEKPSKFYEMLAKYTPEPRIDIFARQRHFGFSAFGDQVEDKPATIESFCG